MKKRTVFIMLFFISAAMAFAVSTNVRLNSIGFLPNNDKHATISGTCSAFTVINVSNGSTAFSGTVSGPNTDSGTGENNLYTADFSTLTTTGTYYLNVAGIGTSVNFTIAPDVYNASFIPIFKALYLARCGTAVSETYGGNTFSHPACHTGDANNSKVGGAGTIVPSESGWHDAGDYNKYTVNAGITLGMLFMAWEQQMDIRNFWKRLNGRRTGCLQCSARTGRFMTRLVKPDLTLLNSRKMTPEQDIFGVREMWEQWRRLPSAP